MHIANETPFAVQVLPMLGPGENPVLALVVKGTFDMVSDSPAPVSAEQIPVFFGDQLYDPVRGGSVKFESDAAPFKPKGDIALVGRAHAPGKIPVKALDVMMRVGSLKKRLRVIGDRTWSCLGALWPAVASEPKPFTEMGLVYERSFGGIDRNAGAFCRENISGCGFYAKKSKKNLHGAPLANIEDPEHRVKSWKDHPKPVGFGFYGKTWAPRLECLGTYDENWQKHRAPRPPLDFRLEYYNAAHPQLQVPGYLKGNEEVELVNLTPGGQLRFWLPGTAVTATVIKSFELLSGEIDPANRQQPRPLADPVQEEAPMNIDTLCLIPEEKRLYMVWRGSCPIRDLTGMEVKQVRICVS